MRETIHKSQQIQNVLVQKKKLCNSIHSLKKIYQTTISLLFKNRFDVHIKLFFFLVNKLEIKVTVFMIMLNRFSERIFKPVRYAGNS